VFHEKHSSSSTATHVFLNSVEPGRDWSPALTLLERYADLLLQHAGPRNLLSASQRNSQSIWSHIFDSLQPLAFGLLDRPRTLIDAGSGGGLPGVPLAIAIPSCKVLLVERSNSKAEFLELVRAILPLTNATISAAELESFLREQPSNSMVLARALMQPANWPELLNKSSENPSWTIFATESNQNEWIEAASSANLHVTAKHEYSLPDSSAKRVLLQFS